jgi:hypothetical protein
MFEILEVIGFILKLIFRIIFEIILYNIGHYTIRIITLGNYSKKNKYNLFELLFFDLIGMVVLILLSIGLFFLVAQL